MSVYLLAQFFGFAGLALSLCVFQVNKRSHMLRFNIVAASLYSIQYLLLGAFTGAALNIIGGSRNYVYYKVSPSKKHRWILLTFIGLAAAGTLLTWQGPVSLLAMMGSICGTFSVWQKNPTYIRRWALLAPPLWFVYNFVAGSYPGMISEMIMLLSNLLGEYRFDFKHPYHAKRRFARAS